MRLGFDSDKNATKKVGTSQIDTYVLFRSFFPKPPSEDAHIRHILRYYLSRALLKQEKEGVYLLPDVTWDGLPLHVDVLAQKGDQFSLAICEPESITPATEEILERVKDVEGLDVIVLHSQYGSPGNVEDRFSSQIESGKFRIMAVVPPPFDDVYEYDIWMFETTFREIFKD